MRKMRLVAGCLLAVVTVVLGAAGAARAQTQAPTISTISPSSGPVGASVTITGAGFTGATAVRFTQFSGTITTQFTVVSDTTITATVPSGSTDGPVAVNTPAGTATSSGSFIVVPTISAFSPSSGPVGTPVTITGTGFTGAHWVTIGNMSTDFTVVSDTTITAKVPVGAVTGPVTVVGINDTSSSYVGWSSGLFSVTPTISSISYSSGLVGSVLEISGSAFEGYYTSVTGVSFNGTPATFRVLNEDEIYAKVPSGATTGPVTVTTTAGTASSQGPFTVINSGSYYASVLGNPTLLAYWRLGDPAGGGNSAFDIANLGLTQAYPGTYINGPMLGSPGAIVNDPSTSVTFNGTNQRVNLPALPSATDFTIEGWTYLTNSAVNNNTLYGNIRTVRLLARPGTGSWRTAAYAGVTLNGTEYVLQPTSPASNINTWVYYALTRQGGTMTLYRNGVQIAQRTDLPATATANINGDIGDQANGNYYLTGRIEDVAIYTSALSASTIASHYQAALSGPAPPAGYGNPYP